MKAIWNNYKSMAGMAIVCGSLAISISGCVNGFNRPFFGGPDRPEILKHKAKYLLTFNYTEPTNSLYYLKKYNAAANDTNAQKTVRNEILNDLMSLIDYNYHQYEDTVRSDKAVQELGADIATLGLTAAATVAGGAETKTILSAIATGVVGVNSSIDKEIYVNNTIQALQMQMRASRAQVECKLNSGMTNDVATYPLQYGMRDVIAYYYAGTLNEALVGLVQQASNNAATNQVKAQISRTPAASPGK